MAIKKTLDELRKEIDNDEKLGGALRDDPEFLQKRGWELSKSDQDKLDKMIVDLKAVGLKIWRPGP